MLAIEPRFPHVPRDAGHYESVYLRAGHPTEPRAIWIRHTVFKRPGGAPRGSVWFTLFDGTPRAAKVTTEDVAGGGDSFIRVGDSRFGPGRVEGRALGASWALAYEPREPPFEHLPRAWMYTAALPRTKVLSPAPVATFAGSVTVDGRTLELDGWLGMIGHNWGAEHAERWVWAHGVGFDGQPDAWLDVTIGRVKLGPVTTPWIANGCLAVAGERHRLGGVERVLSTRTHAEPGRCELELPLPGGRLRGVVSAPREDTVAWVYADPSGGEHNTLNCSAAALELTLERSAEPPLTLRTAAGGSYELGTRDTQHGIELQPFPDG